MHVPICTYHMCMSYIGTQLIHWLYTLRSDISWFFSILEVSSPSMASNSCVCCLRSLNVSQGSFTQPIVSCIHILYICTYICTHLEINPIADNRKYICCSYMINRRSANINEFFRNEPFSPKNNIFHQLTPDNCLLLYYR